MLPRELLFAVATYIIASCVVPVSADVFLRYRRIEEGYETKGRPVAPETTYTTLWVGSQKVRCDDGGVRIIDFEERRLYELEPRDHSYTVLPLDSAAIYQWRMLRTPEEGSRARAARQAAENLLRVGRISVRVRAGREVKGINGVMCRRWEIVRTDPEGRWSGDVWVTGQIPVDPYRLFVGRNITWLGIEGFAETIAALTRMQGVPVREICTAQICGRHVIVTEQLIEFGEKAAPTGAYEVPRDYVARAWTPKLGGGRRYQR